MGYQTLLKLLMSYSKNDAEKAHKLAIWFLSQPFAPKLLSLLTGPEIRDSTKVAGIEFPNKVGLAAGFDKNAEAIPALSKLFGFIEIGTVLPHPQRGNDRPRIFRLPEDNAIINRMGFNSEGVDVVLRRLQALKDVSVPLGASLGKMKGTEIEDAEIEYIEVLKKLWSYVGYFTINVSSPNTPGLRLTQEQEALRSLIRLVLDVEKLVAQRRGLPSKPILVKLAPDMSNDQLDAAIDVLLEENAGGAIIGNTTLSRVGLQSKHAKEVGGASGPILFNRMVGMVERTRHIAPNLPIVAVGGIGSGEQALTPLRAGANLIQVYTGFIYQGPQFPKNVAEYLRINS